MLQLEEKDVCCSIRMALIPRFAFFTFLLLPYQCEAKAENCSETQCLLLPVGDDLIASEFRLKASEKGVRLVYINLVIGNASYDPLELPDEFLPHRWIWANTSHEPMLSLPDDYDILSVGLLNYQVRSMDVKLKDQPSGCLAKLKSTCQNLVIGRMLLENVTSSSSGDILHIKRPVVCVAVINTTRTDDSNKYDTWYQCCDMHKEARTGRTVIWCDQRIDVGNWMAIVNKIFSLLSVFLALFAPALPLVLPDYVFSLEDEVEKENCAGEQINMETTGYQRITNPVTVGDHDNQRGTRGDRNNTEQVALHTVTTDDTYTVTTAARCTTTSTATANNNNYNQGETAQNTSNSVGNSREREEESEFIPVDDSSPMNLSTLLRECFQKFPDIPLSFNIKLAAMCLCVYPCVFYIQTGLYNTLKKTSIDEIVKKHVRVGSVFSSEILFVNVKYYEHAFWVGPIVLIIFVLVLFSRPNDFFLEENEICSVCRKISERNIIPVFSLVSRRSLGVEIHRHLKFLHYYVWYHTLRFGNSFALICYCLSLGGVREKMQQMSRTKHLCCVSFRLISFIFALPFIVLGGALCLLILIIVLTSLLFVFSPIVTISVFYVIKIRNRLKLKKVIVRLIVVLVVFYLIALYEQVSLLFLGNSCLFIISVVGYTIIGLTLNVSTVTPFLAFLLVLTTNLYLCYAKLQSKYMEVKKMISERLQIELHMNSNVLEDTIRAEIYWFVCDKVLPIKSEMCRMLRNMVLVTAFLFLALSSIVFFGKEYDISTLTTTISVFFTGSIPTLFLKVLAVNGNIIGWAKIKMKREIDKVVREYRDSRNGEAAGHQIADLRD